MSLESDKQLITSISTLNSENWQKVSKPGKTGLRVQFYYPSVPKSNNNMPQIRQPADHKFKAYQP